MPVMEMGRQLPSVYLTRFNPAENVPMRISLLDTARVLGTEYHWVDIPSLNIKGSYSCCGGACCEAYGPRIQSYCVPIWVYVDPKNSTEGEMQVWSLTKTVYQDLCSLLTRYDLLNYDLEVTVHQQGHGKKTSIILCPDASLRLKMPDDFRQKLQKEVEDFYANAEATIVHTVSAEDWTQLLMQAGYDFQSRQWLPGCGPNAVGNGRVAMAQATSARGAVGNVPRPTASVAPSRQALPNIRQAPAPTGQTVAPQPAPAPVQAVAPQPTVQAPVAQVPPVPPAPVGVAPVQVQAPQAVQPIPQPQVQAPQPVQAPAPVGVGPAPVASAPVAPAPTAVNSVPGNLSAMPDELNNLLAGI